jgi:hypothetical protein
LLTHDDGELKQLFMEWVEKSLDWYVAACETAESGSDNVLVKESSRISAVSTRDTDTTRVSEMELVSRARGLVEQFKNMAGKAVDHASKSGFTNDEMDGHRCKRAQLRDIQAMYQDTCREFHADLQQNMAWYQIRSNLQG